MHKNRPKKRAEFILNSARRLPHWAIKLWDYTLKKSKNAQIYAFGKKYIT